MDRGELFIRLEAKYRLNFMLNRYINALNRRLMDCDIPELWNEAANQHTRNMLVAKTACIVQYDRDLNK